jgi:hypothetical protein
LLACSNTWIAEEHHQYIDCRRAALNSEIAEELPTTCRLQKSSVNTWIAEEFDQHRNLGIALAVFQQSNMTTIHEEEIYHRCRVCKVSFVLANHCRSLLIETYR